MPIYVSVYVLHALAEFGGIRDCVAAIFQGHGMSDVTAARFLQVIRQI
jgi:hypothetical protein